jgi:3-oxoacyl-[acyl-carrier protein] reductase
MYSNRSVLITGAAGGIGSVLVERFLANGDSIIATDADASALESWRARWSPDARLSVLAADISSGEAVSQLAQSAQRQHGTLDILINCAGYFPIHPFEKMSEEQWRRVIDINLTGCFLVTHAMLPLMKRTGWGRIINFGSGSAFHGTPGQAHYVASKAGIVGFSRTLAREVGTYGITVNVVTPGLTVTRTVRENFPPELLEMQRKRRAIQRDELPEDLAGPVFFLASPDSNFITGQILNVDGGSYMH